MIQVSSVCDVFVGDSVCFANRWWSVIAFQRQSGSGEIKLTLEFNKLRIIQLFHSSVFLPCKKGKGEIKPVQTNSEEKAYEWPKTRQAKEIEERAALRQRKMRQQKRRNKRKIGGENDIGL